MTNLTDPADRREAAAALRSEIETTVRLQAALDAHLDQIRTDITGVDNEAFKDAIGQALTHLAQAFARAADWSGQLLDLGEDSSDTAARAALAPLMQLSKEASGTLIDLQTAVLSARTTWLNEQLRQRFAPPTEPDKAADGGENDKE